ncbi:MAG TPA: LysR family transcriptional regulator [Povalibacter sp.]|uniref:LysR family transcriptional regulator n=1 Tax=Povalibacter sp. TaxID=1962978 RepID=UPI002BFF209F|nr:LysR family transcriptional regulator [Povalibacter sp.]HMN43751.1 LysR family transcriptional regulator [Povalibacter sp.]
MTHIDRNRIKRLDGTLLLVFRELVRCRRTTAAAERLGLSQSAVSHVLGRLRQLFEDPLFIRRPNGLEPTRRALEIAPMIDDLILRAQETMDIGRGFDPATTYRQFRLAGADFDCTLTAARILRSFECEAPHARISFRMLMGEEALGALSLDEIDLAIGRFDCPLPEALYADALYEERYCVIARQRHPRIRGEIDLDAYTSAGHVIVTASGTMTDVGERPLQQLGVTRRVVASVPRFLIAFTVVSQTDSIATVPLRLARRYADSLRLQILTLPFEYGSHSVIALRRAQAGSDPAIDWLVTKVRAAIRTAHESEEPARVLEKILP